MNNGEREITSLLKGIEHELTNLKTAHQRPLGALNFFKRSVNADLTLEESFGVYATTIDIIVTIDTPTAKPPLVQVGWNTPPNFTRPELISHTISYDYTTWTFRIRLLTTFAVSTTTLNFTATSSQPINSMSWEYVQ